MSFGKKTVLARGEYVVYREEGSSFVEVVTGDHTGALFLIKSGGFRQVDPSQNLTVVEDFNLSTYKLVQGRAYWIAWHMS